MCTLRVWILVTVCILVGSPGWAQTGGVFVTGHDSDFHANQVNENATGARNIINRALDYVTTSSSGPVLLVTDRRNPGAGYSDPALGLAAAGVTFELADNGFAGGAVHNVANVNFSNYRAVVVASDFGGWLRQDELNLLNARSADLLSYINSGGGLVAFAESGGLTTSNRFKFLPFLVASNTFNQAETGNQVTPFGASLGLMNSDINGNFSHNVFTATGGMNVVDVDPSGNILSLAARGTFTAEGVTQVPEPASALLLLPSLALLIPYRRRGQPR